MKACGLQAKLPDTTGGSMTLKTLVLLSMIAVMLLTWQANGYLP